MKNKVWFITGASKGLGLTLTKKLLENGYHVAATSRNLDELLGAVSAAPRQFLGLKADLTNEHSVDEALQTTVKYFGSIDIVVNNAGYAQFGGVEETLDEEVRENFNVNVFASLHVIRKALPYLREQKSGHILNIASIGGFTGAFPGFGIYAATKFAMHGLSESLSEEVKPFGIGVTIVSPGYFRTSFLESNSLHIPKNEIAEYTNVREAQKAHQQAINGNQPGDPEKAAEVMIEISKLGTKAPLHLFLGQDAYDLAAVKIRSIEEDLKNFEKIAIATAFEN